MLLKSLCSGQWSERNHPYRKRWLGCPPKQAITKRKLEDEATQLSGHGALSQASMRLWSQRYVGVICNFGARKYLG
jgi:DMSO/TMAO reductase YedYZ molybdopterin-dependent catalytic subunit